MADQPILDLTEEFLVPSADDDSLRALATAAAAHRPLPPSPAPIGPQPVTPVFPPAKAAAYAHREVRVITTPSGGYGVIVGSELVGVAEQVGRLQTLVAEWAKAG